MIYLEGLILLGIDLVFLIRKYNEKRESGIFLDYRVWRVIIVKW